MILLTYMLLIILGMLLLLMLVLATQVLCACLPLSRKQEPEITPASIAILIPAHNEALGIGYTLSSLSPQLRSQDRIVVVADNCHDNTADIARNAGAEALERHDLSKRGKGYALDFGLNAMQQNPPEVVVIVDADCIVAPGAITKLAARCRALQRPVQALYLMKNLPDAGIKARISEFAWVVKNWVRPLGMHKLGLPCQLMGTGMAFLWHDLRKMELATGHIVEDMKLGVDFAQTGKAPTFLPDALVTSYFPSENAASSTQRTRWEHGHLGVIMQEVPKLMLHALSTGNVQMLTMAIDLAVPPLALLSMLCGLLGGVAVLTYLGYPDVRLLVLPMILLGALFLAIGLAWAVFGRNVISLGQLCYIPVYIMAKLPIYLKFLVRRQLEWVRSKRD